MSLSDSARSLSSQMAINGPFLSVNENARRMGWGWHRTNNAMKELGWK